MSARLPLTKYHQVYLVLREQLQEGLFAQGLPAEIALAQQFAVGRVTIRHAMEQLVAEGLIVRVAGRGTFPTPAARSAAAQAAGVQARPTRLAGLMENIVSASRATTVKVLDWRTVAASESVSAALQIEAGSPVRKAVRRRSSREGPLSYITTYMPQSLLAGVSRRALAGKPLLQLLEESGVELGRAQQTISARPADAQVAAELGVAIGTALLAVRRLVYDAQDRPVQWLEGLYRPDRYEYQMEVSRIGSVDARIAVKQQELGAQGSAAQLQQEGNR
jgi:GntR family transcriptional regulator